MKKLYFSIICMIVALSAAASSGIYIRGGMNGWGTSEDWEFSDEGNGVYALYDVTLSGQFKIADASWGTINYGGDGSKVSAGQNYTLYHNGSNITTNGTIECSRVVFTLNSNGASLYIEGQTEDPNKPLTEVYVIGNFCDWDFNSTAGKLALSESKANTYTGTITLTDSGDGLSYWRVFTGLGMVGEYGIDGDNLAEHTWSGTLTAEKSGCIVSTPGTYDIEVVLVKGQNTCQYKLAETTSISNIAVAENANAKYYNLLGVKVEKPAKGIYIKVVGSKATKVVFE